MKSELTRSFDYTLHQAELYALLQRQARLYTMGDSSSLPAETAQELLHSIRFTVNTQLQYGAAAGSAATLEELFAEGGRTVWALCESGKGLFVRARRTAPHFGSVALRDTLDAVGGFFRAYDLRFFAHGIPCMIDYPLCLPVPGGLQGILFINEYLRHLILENRFCGCFDRQECLRALTALHPEFRKLVLGLFEPLLTCALGAALLGREGDSLALAPNETGQLYRLLHPWEEERARGAVQGAVNRLCIRYRLWDSDMRAYLLQASENLLPLFRSTSPEGYSGLFCAE